MACKPILGVDIADWGGSVMASIKRDRVWAPDPIEGYVLGYVTDFNGDTLTIELVDSAGQVAVFGWS